MIQRIQSVWLLLSAVAIAGLYKLPVYGGVLQNDTVRNLLAGERYHLAILATVLVLLPFITIFFFKNRTTQKKFIWIQILLLLVFIVLIWMAKDPFINDLSFRTQQFKIGAVLPVVSIVFAILAYRGIRHDEKLIRSVDRLR